ncbi:MAG TPA: hypothetical protein VG938_17435 [Verrucomicrobiae bacterium]|jgi:hypothetical protein|nr:hypothetical protein [Verrucomicrobiae bacterium]
MISNPSRAAHLCSTLFAREMWRTINPTHIAMHKSASRKARSMPMDDSRSTLKTLKQSSKASSEFAKNPVGPKMRNGFAFPNAHIAKIGFTAHVKNFPQNCIFTDGYWRF